MENFSGKKRTTRKTLAKLTEKMELGEKCPRKLFKWGNTTQKKGVWRPNDRSRNLRKTGECGALCQATMCKRRKGPIKSKDGKHPQIWINTTKNIKIKVKGTGLPKKIGSTLIQHTMK